MAYDQTSHVYLLHDDSCSSPAQDGYIGVSAKVDRRVRDHRRNGVMPKDFEVTVLFSGSREDCFRLERELRPSPLIGWNTQQGGCNGFRDRFPESSLKKISDSKRGKPRPDLLEANLKRWASPDERRKLADRNRQNPWSKGRTDLRGRKYSAEARAKISKALIGNKYASGKPNWNRGGTMSDEAKAKMRAAWVIRRARNIMEGRSANCSRST